MNEFNPDAIAAAKAFAREFGDDAREALIHHVQQVSDIAALIRASLLQNSFPFEHELVKLATSLMLPGDVPSRAKSLPKCEGCPLCGATMQQTMIAGKSAWLHPIPDEPGDDACMFAGFRLRLDQLPKWNQRTKTKTATQIARGPCGVCGSLTPESYSQVCGEAACPHK